MNLFLRILKTECIKLKGSAEARLLWAFPLLFLLVTFWMFERPFLSIKSLPAPLESLYRLLPLKMTAELWAGFFHPLMIALVPAMIVWPEHRYRMWGHLHGMPLPRSAFFVAKTILSLLISLFILILTCAALYLLHFFLKSYNPLLAVPFPGWELLKLIGWLWVGSMPLITFYVWAADRIASLAVSVVFGLIGLLLTISLSGQEVNPSWKRDLIPWILPYYCAQQAMPALEGRKESHSMGVPFERDPYSVRLPDGKKKKVTLSVPMDKLFPPPPPTPPRTLLLFSIALAFLLMIGGMLDARRSRP